MCWSRHRCIPTPACSVEPASGCPAASCLAALYRLAGKRSPRGGANIPRRIEIAARIASCRVSLARSASDERGDAWPGARPGTSPTALPAVSPRTSPAALPIFLTRMNLRLIGVCSSEATDLCEFFQQLAHGLGADTRVLFERKERRQMALYVLPDRLVDICCARG